MYDSILVATDGSDAATDAVERGVELARRLEVPVHGVAVVEERTAYDNAIVDPEEVEARLEERAQAALSALEEAALEAGVSAVTAIRSGVPHEEILTYAAEHDVDVIVVGARGRSSFRRALLGSTADAVVRYADVPVLLVGGEDSRSQ
ncbi:universal stress protein [Natrialbaceae archaeon GCM10025810]|uniref:universal stress protein n=1 Tax=Halovalidus salilacus TaxID=3075124 RepID=UPI00360D531F